MLQNSPSKAGHPDLYAHKDLVRLVNPASVAIVGASPRPGSFGSRAAANLKGFGGRVYLVNARYDEIDGARCYPSLSALPEVPDCALLMVSQAGVEEVLGECVALGVGGVIVHASGYAEIGNAAAQSRLVALTRNSSTRLFGPNSLGIGNYVNGARMTFGRMPPMRDGGKQAVGLVCQSGAIGMALSQAIERGVPISHVFMLGNAADVDLADCISYLAEDENCAAIACVFEGTDQPDRLVAAGRKTMEAGKPLIVYKMAVSTQGAAAAMSHTGMLAGSNEAYKTSFQRAGIVMVDCLEEVIETARFFAKAGRPKAPGTGVIVTSGGAGVMAADKAETGGVPMPQPQTHTLEVLKSVLPEFGSPRNPCDITAQVLNDENSFVASVEAMMEDSGYGSLVIAHMFADDIGTRRLPVFNDLAQKHGKIVCNYWASEWLEGPGAVEAEQAPGIAMFRSLDRCMRTLARWNAREKVLSSPSGSLPTIDPAIRSEVHNLITSSEDKIIGERASKAALLRYGVPVVQDMMVDTLEAAVSAAEAIGYPVVLKVDSPAIPHKTEAGVVALDIRDRAALETAYRRVTANAARVVDPSQILGVLVQPMIGKGLEILVGGRLDPAFGPLLVVGFGGVFVELIRDTATLPVPSTPGEVKEALMSLRGRALFDGFRGNPSVDLDALSEVVSRASVFLADHADLIGELDVNPLICADKRILAADALIVRA